MINVEKVVLIFFHVPSKMNLANKGPKPDISPVII